MSSITCHLCFEVDPESVGAFERFAKRSIALVERSGGRHHGYRLPDAGAADVAHLLYTFPDAPTHEAFRRRFRSDADFLAADRLRRVAGCALRYELTFQGPVLEERVAA